MKFKTAFSAADILLPKNEDMTKWAVVACDQYTSEPEYWKSVCDYVGGAKSTVKLMLPEVWLEDENVDGKICDIHGNMSSYLESGVFSEYKNSFVYVERTQSDGKIRAGLVGKIDLEQYDYRRGSVSPVRATEATVVERIPPRIKVRRGAEIELPHIMILIDDPEMTVVEAVGKHRSELKKLYDFELMKNGGHIKGYLVGEKLHEMIDEALFGLSSKSGLLFAMGDGNHSLATAKEYYEELKRQNPNKDLSAHPARYALVEIVNLHSPALRFEAIHRIVTEVDADRLIDEMTKALELSDEKSGQGFEIVINGKPERRYIHAPKSKLTVGSVQAFLDDYLSENGGKVDYIHGSEVVINLSQKPKSIGFLFEDMAKSDLFPTVEADGALPRKTFSMGHAQDKRFYIECRRISE